MDEFLEAYPSIAAHKMDVFVGGMVHVCYRFQCTNHHGVPYIDSQKIPVRSHLAQCAQISHRFSITPSST